MTKGKLAAIISGGVAAVAAVVCGVIFLPKLFATTGMSTKCIMLFVVFSIATEPLFRYLTKLVSGVRKLHMKIHKKPVEEF